MPEDSRASADQLSVEDRRGEYWLSTDVTRMNVDMVHGYLTRVYWSKGIPREIVERSMQNSLCFGLFCGTEQVGFARVITDYATFAYVADVFVLEQYRRRGLATWLMEFVMKHPGLQGLRRWALATRDAHGLYKKVGFKLLNPDRWMEIIMPDIYKKKP
jgi:ribosomal protein S18 acetylase RimI-like enzyme